MFCGIASQVVNAFKNEKKECCMRDIAQLILSPPPSPTHPPLLPPHTHTQV